MRRPFYGWIIVGVAFLIGITEAGVFQNILSIFMKPMVNDFGWSRASITGAIAFGSISGGLVSPVIGPILDRYGPRMLAFWGITLLSAGLAAMAFMNHLWQLYLFFGMGRMIAVGVLSLVISVSVSNWFVRLRGRALGITRVGDRIGSTLLPLMVQFLILSLGWRMAWGALGLVVFFMSGIPAILFLKRRPEDIGLLPDGALRPESKSGADPLSHQDAVDDSDDDPEPVWTRSQAAHTRAFWLLTVINSLIPFIQAGINFHIYPLLTDQGFSATTAVFILSTMSIFGTAGTVIWGVLTEKFRIQGLFTANVIGNALIFLLLYWAIIYRVSGVLGVGMIFFLAALHGTFHGGRNPMITIMWADFYGRRSLGSVLGLSNPFHFGANALGPVFAALCFDQFGSYAIPFYLFAAFFILSGLIALGLQPPRHPSQLSVRPFFS